MKAREDDALYVRTELTKQHLIIPSRLIVTSVHNAGAEAIAYELCEKAARIGDGPACFLLLLDTRTYSTPALATDVIAALDEGRRVVLVHDASVEFSDVMRRTPKVLMDRGIYDELVVALYPDSESTDASASITLRPRCAPPRPVGTAASAGRACRVAAPETARLPVTWHWWDQGPWPSPISGERGSCSCSRGRITWASRVMARG